MKEGRRRGKISGFTLVGHALQIPDANAEKISLKAKQLVELDMYKIKSLSHFMESCLHFLFIFFGNE